MTRFSNISACFLLFLTFCLPIHSAQPASGCISGLVISADSGEPIPSIRIWIFDSEWNLTSASTYSDSEGMYTSGPLASGKYYVKAMTWYPVAWVPEYWNHTTDPDMAVSIPVAEGVTVHHVDFQLTRGGFLTGTIRANTGEALENVDLDVYDSDWKWIKSFSARTESNGSYILGAMLPGNYFVRADPDVTQGRQQRYWPDAYYRESAVFIALHADETIPGIDFSLPEGAVFSGCIRNFSTEPAPDVEVTVYSTDWTRQPIHRPISDASGNYTAFGLPPGAYFARAVPEKGSGMARIYYPDATNRDDAQPVSVSLDSPVNGINFLLPEGNFDLELTLDISSSILRPGMEFYLNADIVHSGPELENLPLLCILNVSGTYYFWPGWGIYDPPEHPFIDYALRTVPKGCTRENIIPAFTWPETVPPLENLQFISAFCNRGFTDLACDISTIDWESQ